MKKELSDKETLRNFRSNKIKYNKQEKQKLFAQGKKVCASAACQDAGMPIQIEMFYKRAASSDGLDSLCAECRRAAVEHSRSQWPLQQKRNRAKQYLRRKQGIVKCKIAKDAEVIEKKDEDMTAEEYSKKYDCPLHEGILKDDCDNPNCVKIREGKQRALDAEALRPHKKDKMCPIHKKFLYDDCYEGVCFNRPRDAGVQRKKDKRFLRRSDAVKKSISIAMKGKCNNKKGVHKSKQNYTLSYESKANIAAGMRKWHEKRRKSEGKS